MRTFAFVVLAAWSCAGQVAKEANAHYQNPATRVKIAASLVETSRDARQRPKELMAVLNVQPGWAVADIGSGSGYMLPYLAEAVGPNGKVFAEDIFPDFLEAAKKHAAKYSNVSYVLGNEKSVNLPASAVDLAMILDAYHHFDYPSEMLGSIRRALKPGGRLVIVEYHKNETAMPNRNALTHIRLTQDEFVKEIEGFGFRAVSVKDFLPDVQWMGVFEAK